MRTIVETIDITPTWESLIPVLVHLAAEGQTAQARSNAMGELLRLARAVDRIVVLEKDGPRLPPCEVWGPSSRANGRPLWNGS